MNDKKIALFVVEVPTLIVIAGMILMLLGHSFGAIISLSALPCFISILWLVITREPRPDGEKR